VETLRPHKTIKKWDIPWRNLGKTAGLPGLRFHDLRHTIITELAGMDLPDQVTGVYDGHSSRRRLEHDSHLTNGSQKTALEALD